MLNQILSYVVGCIFVVILQFIMREKKAGNCKLAMLLGLVGVLVYGVYIAFVLNNLSAEREHEKQAKIQREVEFEKRVTEELVRKYNLKPVDGSAAEEK